MRDITRRDLLASIAATLGSYAALGATAAAQTPNVDAGSVTYRSGQVDVPAYLAKPKGAGPHPVVLVIHDNRGLSDHVRDVARRFASEGFVALAPDLLSRGGQAPPAAIDDLRAGLDYLGQQPNVDTARLASVGFGWGGWRCFTLAAAATSVRKAVIFYSSSPDVGYDRIQASVLAHYAEWDNQVTGNALWTKEMMEKAGKTFRYYVYPKTDSGFFNDAGPDYSANAAMLAWKRTIDFLKS